jgi:hypothetical protein
MKYQLALRDRTGSLGVLLPKQPRHFEQLTAFILQHLNRRISTHAVRVAEKSSSVFSVCARGAKPSHAEPAAAARRE